MSQVTISEAAKLVGRDRKTLYKDIKAGRLSATLSATDVRQVDTAELIRVYGELGDTGDSRATVANPQEATAKATEATTELRVKLAAAEAELEQMRERLKERDGHISDLRGMVRLLTAPKPAPAPAPEPDPWWKIW